MSVVTQAQPQVSLVTRSLSFEPNQGQDASAAEFIAHGPGYLVQLSPTELAFRLSRDRTVKLDLLNAKSGLKLGGENFLPGKANYFPSSDRSQWHSNIPTYERVSEHGTYPGIDLAFYGSQNRLEYDFLLKPNTDASQIQLRLSGSDQAKIDAHGNLVINVGHKQVSLLKPVAYQTAKDSNAKEVIDASYHLESGLLSFNLGPYDHTRALVIDPVLQYSEYLYEQVSAISVDAAGNTYILTSTSYNNSTLSVTKISPANATVFSSTFGTGLSGTGLAVDALGRAYLTGTASPNASLPTGPNSYNSASPKTGSSAFFIQLSADGVSIPFATYLGGLDSSNSQASAIALDASGAVYLAGNTNSPSFPVTAGAYQSTNPSNTTSGFVAKFNPALSGKASLVYSTLIGVPFTDYTPTVLNAIAVDLSGDAYVTASAPTGYPVTNGAFQYTGFDTDPGGIYVTRFSATGTHLIYSAYLGPGTATAIAVDKQANVYVAGASNASDFPTTPNDYQSAIPGGFVVKLDPTGSTEIYSTFLGGPGTNGVTNGSLNPTSLALSPNCPSSAPVVITCKAYVTGLVAGTNLSLINAIENTPASSAQGSAFVVELSDSGQNALLSTYLSGTYTGVATYYSGEASPAIAVDSFGNITVVGNLATEGAFPDFPITVGTPSSYSDQAFLARISPSSASETLAAPSSVSFLSQPVGVSTSLTGGTAKVRLGNFGSAPALLSAIQISPPAAFSQVNDCGTMIPAGGYCTLSIDFVAKSTIATSGSVTVISNANNTPLIIPLSGSGKNADFIQAATNSVAFGPQSIGASKVLPVVLTNVGNARAYLQLYIQGNSPNYFTQNSNCSPTLEAQASCTVSITFSPLISGTFSGSILIQDLGSPATLSIPISGIGSGPASTQTLSVVPSAVTFGPLAVGAPTPFGPSGQNVIITNTSPSPLTIQSLTASGDFTLSSSYCSLSPLDPEGSCQVSVTFAATAAGTRTGTLAISGFFANSPLLVPLTGTGLASTQTVEVYPSTSVTAPDQPVGSAGADQAITLENTGTSQISIYRTAITGSFRINRDSCSGSTVAGTTDDGSGSYATCQVTVDFVPSATGLQTGTVTFYDSTPGSPHVVTLNGNGIVATGSLSLSGSSLNFPAQAVGTPTSQTLYLQNPGDSPIQINSCTATGDFSIAPNYNLPLTLSPGTTSSCVVLFSPTAIGTRTGTVTVHSSAGTQTAALNGTGVAGVKSVQLVPGYSMDFGPILVGQTGPTQAAYAVISGNGPVTFSSYSISGPNAQDFSVSGPCLGNQTPGNYCLLNLQFSPSAAGARMAVITLIDSASGGKQVLNLTGQGVSVLPSVTLSSYFVTFAPQIQGTINYVYPVLTLYNNVQFPISLGNVAASNGFVVNHGSDTCSGQTIAVGGSCVVSFEFAPSLTTSSALISGYLTFTLASGSTLIRLPLAGYSVLPNYSAQITPMVVDFPPTTAIGSSSSSQFVSFRNSGGLPIHIGAVTTSAQFSAASSSDSCSNTTLNAAFACSVSVTFTPKALGAATGALSVSVSYANNTTATFTATLNGTGVAATDNASLSPGSVAFPDQGVGSVSQPAAITLTNTGNQAFAVGTLTGVNSIVGNSTSGEFSVSTQLTFGFTPTCGAATITPGSSCQLNLIFTPSATGTRSGSISFPLTYADQHKSTLVLTLGGNAVPASKQLLIYPASVTFSTTLQGTTNQGQSVYITNIGNVPLTIGQNLISTNSAEFQLGVDQCASKTVAVNSGCSIVLSFKPSAGATGIQTGALTLADNSPGGPHIIPLSAPVIAATQQVRLSQTAVNFAAQTAGTTSPSQTVYVSDATSSVVNVTGVVVSGTNAADFQVLNYCSFFESSCTITVTFAPQAGAGGTRTATITETDSAPGSPRIITLTGTAQ